MRDTAIGVITTTDKATGMQGLIMERRGKPSRESHGRDGSRSHTETDARHPGYDASLYPDPEPIAELQAVAVRPEFNLAPEFNQVSLGNGDKICPIRRPDKGGSLLARHVRLHVNHFRITFNPETIIRHYNIEIKPEAPAKHHHPVRLSKSTPGQIKEKLFSDNRTQFPLSMTTYDGEKNIFSVIALPCGTYNVKMFSGEDSEDSSFQCTIELGMDLVMKENPKRHMISVGQHFYPLEHQETNDLKCGVAAFRGFQHSLKPTSQGLALSLDCSAMAFRKRVPVIDFLKENIHGFSMGQFAKFRRKVEQALKGVKVTVTHRNTKQKYTIVRLTDEMTSSISFNYESSEGKMNKINLVNYFLEKYKIEIKYRDIPCLDISKNNKKQYVPMELCVLVEGQRYPKENLESDAPPR
ncbi:hypothetical protein NL676_012400 [Syzygium grande]|nr:hypothetical protein NL676_012400 [Syzygium grande]